MSDAFHNYEQTVGKAHIDRLKQEAAIAAAIKTKRQQQGLSQQALADAIGKPKSTIGRIEAGITVPQLSTLLAIASVLQTTFSIGASSDTNDKITR
ncbi:helix-turn-helix domain-containing protein [Alkalicoccus luteus]|uniref:Helix-turn-helix transcriptional regulator n=1 Tax=Alkalicoccus luteus TaxID=1237094 RepID=A0A969PU04_9BACI|nr:helix-turn-helix transcriptional regulator [Alkalicoccus luteus]NJP39268.1 helix-turn-helix transcriptional regulator [Alkalicoccus luteus]